MPPLDFSGEQFDLIWYAAAAVPHVRHRKAMIGHRLRSRQTVCGVVFASGAAMFFQ
jgi:hypothetical protein